MKVLYSPTAQDGTTRWLEFLAHCAIDILADGHGCTSVVVSGFSSFHDAQERFWALRPGAGFAPTLPTVERLATAYQASGCERLFGTSPSFWANVRAEAAERDKAGWVVVAGKARVTADGDVIAL